MRTFEQCATVERVDALADAAAIDGQATAAIAAKVSRVRDGCLAMRAAKAVGMEMLVEPRHTGVGIQQGENWKIHVHQYTKVALLVLLSQEEKNHAAAG